MADDIKTNTALPQKWVFPNGYWKKADPENCTKEHLQKALSHIERLFIKSAELNTSGEFVITEESAKTLNGFPGAKYSDLPDYLDVRIGLKGEKHTETMLIWLPMDWNRRFLSIGGAGNRTDNGFGFDLPNTRVFSVPNAVKNGFVGALTDGGVETPMAVDWALDKETGKIDWELLRNFGYLSSHRLAVITKEVIRVVYGELPLYSYMQGSSGGGRQAVVEAQMFPDDFDGIWADCPAINWTKFIPAELWPSLVMNEYKNILTPAKLDAFKDDVIIKNGGKDKFYSMVERPSANAFESVGKKTPDGIITELDAKVMQLIWDGAKDENGNFLWYGLRPGTESWDLTGVGLICSSDEEINPFFLSTNYLGQWVLKKSDWDWRSLTIEQFGKLFKQGVKEFNEIASDNPDLTELCKSGHKLMITVGANDPLIFPDGTIEYYEHAAKVSGSKESLRESAVLFIFPGTGHGFCSGYAPSFTMSDGMSALMHWVENGEKPEKVTGHQLDPETLNILREDTIEAY